MRVPGSKRWAVAVLLLLPACCYATNPCAGHRNVIEGVVTTEVDSNNVVTNSHADIHGCGNVVAGNTVAAGTLVYVEGSDNVVESNAVTRTDHNLTVLGTNNSIIGNVADYIGFYDTAEVRRRPRRVRRAALAARDGRRFAHRGGKLLPCARRALPLALRAADASVRFANDRTIL